jgi:hypothetical protein
MKTAGGIQRALRIATNTNYRSSELKFAQKPRGNKATALYREGGSAEGLLGTVEMDIRDRPVSQFFTLATSSLPGASLVD